MSSLPDELYHEILLRVPVKFAYACKCVCKTWFNVVSDPSFVKSHLVRTSQKNNPNLMHGRCDNSKNIDLIRAISYDSLILNGLGDDVVNTLVEKDNPFKSPEYVVQLVGCCNGMVCLFICQGNKPDFACVIWNPATNEYKELTALHKFNSRDRVGLYAFGYDHKKDDYKLVTVDDYCCRIHVYTIGSNLWESFQSDNHRFPYKRQGVLFNGILHWLGGRIDHAVTWLTYRCIICFDMCENRIKEIRLPKGTLESRIYPFMSVGVLKGCLCTLVIGNGSTDVWVMQDYGVPESWSKRYSITDERIMNNDKLSLVYSFKNGHMLFSALCKLFSYDPKLGSVREVNIQTSSIFGSEEFISTAWFQQIDLETGAHRAIN